MRIFDPIRSVEVPFSEAASAGTRSCNMVCRCGLQPHGELNSGQGWGGRRHRREGTAWNPLESALATVIDSTHSTSTSSREPEAGTGPVQQDTRIARRRARDQRM